MSTGAWVTLEDDPGQGVGCKGRLLAVDAATCAGVSCPTSADEGDEPQGGRLARADDRLRP